MTVLQVELIDPRAKALLEELAKLDLIRIQGPSSNDIGFLDLVKETRTRAMNSKELTLEEITKEVEEVRSNRFGQIG
jgi:hypothetical protein